MSEEKIFIEKFGKKYYCLRQRNTIPCRSTPKKTSNPLNGINNCSGKKRKLKEDRIVDPNQLEVEENRLYKSVDILENIVSFKLSNIKQFKPPANRKEYFDIRLNEFIRINQLAVGILDEIQYSADVINDLKIVQIIFNHNLSQLQCIEDEQKYVLEGMKKLKLSCMDRFLRFVSCPCCS